MRMDCITHCVFPVEAMSVFKQHKRAKARIEIEAMRLMVLRAAKAMDTLGNAEDFPAAKFKGHKVQVKGVLTKVANPFRISVQSLESVNDVCTP